MALIKVKEGKTWQFRNSSLPGSGEKLNVKKSEPYRLVDVKPTILQREHDDFLPNLLGNAQRYIPA